MSMNFVKTEVLLLDTPEAVRSVAQRLKDLGGSITEREEWVKRYNDIKDAILGGRMTPFRWCVGDVPTHQLRKRVNGQHSSQVFLDLTPEEWAQVRFPVVVYWEDYTCDRLIDLPILFEQFDKPTSARSKLDLVGVHLAIHEEFRDIVDRPVGNYAAAGIAWYFGQLEGRRKTAAQQLAYLHENTDIPPYVVWCGRKLSKEKTPEMLLYPAVMAAVFHTTRGDNQRAFAFWEAVAAGKSVNLEDSTEYKLAVFLEGLRKKKCWEDWPKEIREHMKRTAKQPPPRAIFATCLYACHGALVGRKIREVFTPTQKYPTMQDLIAALYPLEPTSV